MRNKLQRFMMGRYGIDKMSQVLSVCSLVLVALGIFLDWTDTYRLYLFSDALQKCIEKIRGESGLFAALLSSDRVVCRKETVHGAQ